jgi:hypothetical protein
MLTARRETELAETVKLATASSGSKNCSAKHLAGDIADELFVKRLFDETVSLFG